MLPLVRLLDGQGTVVIRSSEATDGVGHDAQDLTRRNPESAGTSRSRYEWNAMSEAAKLNCLLPFDTDSTEFARGFEAGRLWELVRADPTRPVDDVLIHAANAEMAMRIGEASGRPFHAVDLGGAWLSISYAAAADDAG